MASRAVYIPASDSVGVVAKNIDFDWFPGFSVAQKQRCITSLHDACARSGTPNVLEISTKSMQEVGVAASAFNLSFNMKKSLKSVSVESAFQGSKVFEGGGPFTELYDEPPHISKKSIRSLARGELVAFEFFGKKFPIIPRTFFYDWLYINTLNRDHEVSERIQRFDAFTDIEFNSNRSINCQAFSAALFVSICRAGLRKEISNMENYSAIVLPFYSHMRDILKSDIRLI